MVIWIGYYFSGDPADLVSISKNYCYLDGWKDLSDLSVLNLVYDVTPPELITMVITEVGMVPCTSVPVVLRVKHAETEAWLATHWAVWQTLKSVEDCILEQELQYNVTSLWTTETVMAVQNKRLFIWRYSVQCLGFSEPVLGWITEVNVGNSFEFLWSSKTWSGINSGGNL